MGTTATGTSHTDSLMRHPSAEDLDAAHQLVSSARVGRDHSVAVPVPSGSFTAPPSNADDPSEREWDMTTGHTIAADIPPPSSSSSRFDAPAPLRSLQLKESPARPVKDGAFLGHCCRWAPFPPLLPSLHLPCSFADRIVTVARNGRRSGAVPPPAPPSATPAVSTSRRAMLIGPSIATARSMEARLPVRSWSMAARLLEGLIVQTTLPILR